MIPKAEILAVAGATGLLPTTVEKDYALGWVLFALPEHPTLGRWVFKGGTCLKKCYFDTYRFSEDLDFTVPADSPYDAASIRDDLIAITRVVGERTGIEFPEDGVELNESINQRGHKTFEARLTFTGPLQLPRGQRQRIRFDLTQDELVVDPPESRPVFHGYSDIPDPVPQVFCYSLNEILAEKVRALFERSGRARDVYDIVNVGRNLQSTLSAEHLRQLTLRKFDFKTLPAPSSNLILARVDAEVLASDWSNALRHQLPVLPPHEEFRATLRELLEWLFGTGRPKPPLDPVPGPAGETTVAPVRFAPAPIRRGMGRAVAPWAAELPEAALGSRMDRIRFAARNRLLALVDYHGVPRLVEPYALRMPRTRNLLLYGYEVQRGASGGEGIKSFKVAELGNVKVIDRSYLPRFRVEL